ncbi:MAG: phytoene desaturase family protein, partial [Candidatus Nanoarchaeia archaeon]
MDGEPTKRPEPSKYYDYVIIGSGQSSLSFAALMVKAGKTVCILEAHDIPGGYAHSFKMGDYHFCAEVHYIWGCEPGGAIYAWLKKLGLEKDITFNKYDEDCYDLMAIPGKKVAIPMGYDKLIKNIVDQWPEDEKGIKRFVHILESIDEEVKSIPNEIKTSMIFKYWYKYPWLLKYRTKTLQDVYDECKLSLEVQTVLAAQAGDYMAPPNELSMLAYNGLFGGYNKGAYYPKKHYKYFVDRIAKFIEDSPGSDIFYETPVTKINVEGDKV